METTLMDTRNLIGDAYVFPNGETYIMGENKEEIEKNPCGYTWVLSDDSNGNDYYLIYK